MNKQKILELTGLSEDQFYDQYPDQETFCSDYPDACNQLEEAQGGMQVGKVYDKYGNETFTPAPDPIHSDWQINDEGMNVRPRTVDRFGNPIGPTTQVLRIPVDRVPFNREPTMQRLNPAIQSLQHESANNVPTTSPIDILTPLIARYNLPKGMMQNSIPIEKLSAKQTMQSVGSTGAPYTAPVNKYKSIVDSLKASGQDSSFASRKKLAEEKGITGYTGTAVQNMALMNAINKGRSEAPLIIPKERGGELEKYKTGREALPTTDPRKVQRYTDSLNAYNSKYELLKALNEWNKNPTDNNKKKYWKKQDDNTKGNFTNATLSTQSAPDGDPDWIYNYKEPVQPYYLQKEQPLIPAAIYQPQIAPTIRDTIMTVLDPGQEWYLNKERDFLYKKKEQGGTAIFPSMRNFKQGGYYGMDQKFHPNSDSGTYVTGAGYYFDTGGGTTASPASAPGTSGGVDVSGVPGAGAAGVTNGIRADGSFAVNDSKMPDGGYDGSGMMMDDSASEQSSPFDYNNSQFSEQSADKQQPYDQQEPYDASQYYDASKYSSEIDPSTGFTKYKKNGLAIRNIKREDPTLWNHLKDEGHGARWATGQTDFQRVGRTAGAIGQGLETGINVAGAIGGYLNNRNKQRNMDKSAINMGSTASMFTNPQGSGKGDYGVTGSTYGQFKPNQVSNMSFKGMYGKYGMQVPKYAVGGFEPQIATLNNNSLMDDDAPELPLYEINKLYAGPNVQRDNTRVAPPIIPVNVREKEISYSNLKASPLPNPSGKDVATRLNNPGNIIYNPIFAKMFGAVDSGVKQTDGTGHFAAFRTIDDGLKARETQLFGTVDGIFKSKYYKPNTDINYALKKWSGGVNKDGSINSKGYGVNIYPEIAGKTLAEITPQERKELMKRQIKQESASMYKYLKSNNYFKYGGQQQGGQVVDMDENQIQQFLAAGGQLEFLD